MRVLLVMKRQINWQEQDLNIRSQVLNQLVASQLEVPRNRNHRKYWESITGLKQAKGLNVPFKKIYYGKPRLQHYTALPIYLNMIWKGTIS
jgi:hypothetical protein